MEKNLYLLAALATGAIFFAACDSNDDPAPPTPVEVSNGAFVVNSGNFSGNVDGSLTYFDYSSNTATNGAFANANGRSLGRTANDALAYGSKLYIVVDGENTIEVVDKTTLRSIKQIKTTELLSETKGKSPRHIAASDGKVYVTTYGESMVDYETYTAKGNGYVAAIDTANFGLARTYTVGAYPEGIAIHGGYAYVANSYYSYGSNGDAYISQVDLSSGSEAKIQGEDVLNPVAVSVVNNDIYFLDYGQYDASWNQKDAGVRKIAAGGTVTRVIDATSMYADDAHIFVINAPYGSGETTYSVYNAKSSTPATLTLSEQPFSPACIGADPVTGHIFIASISKDPETGRANYRIPGYVNEYDADGNLVQSFACGASPQAIVFNTGIAYK